MDPHEIHRMLRQVPFVPFKVVLNDGCIYEIRASGDAMVNAYRLHVGLDPDEHGLFRDVAWIAPDDVARLEPLA
jgi:hypothetical protein